MTSPRPTDAGAPRSPEAPGEISYAEAQAELDAILHELDGDEVDVDVLGARVRRAAELLRLCRDRIAAARFEVEQVVGELEVEAAATGVDLDDDDEVDDEDGDDEEDDDGWATDDA